MSILFSSIKNLNYIFIREKFKSFPISLHLPSTNNPRILSDRAIHSCYNLRSPLVITKSRFTICNPLAIIHRHFVTLCSTRYSCGDLSNLTITIERDRRNLRSDLTACTFVFCKRIPTMITLNRSAGIRSVSRRRQLQQFSRLSKRGVNSRTIRRNVILVLKISRVNILTGVI